MCSLSFKLTRHVVFAVFHRLVDHHWRSSEISYWGRVSSCISHLWSHRHCGLSHVRQTFPDCSYLVFLKLNVLPPGFPNHRELITIRGAELLSHDLKKESRDNWLLQVLHFQRWLHWWPSLGWYWDLFQHVEPVEKSTPPTFFIFIWTNVGAECHTNYCSKLMFQV